ncbi:hypothetical protein BC332_28907 [Capsicum chinense]|nr:hypothetical protein BC332_28907 [Capsicum chinense]
MAVMKRLLVVRFESCLALFKDNLKTLSQVLNSLTSLECLYIGNLPQIQSLLEQRLLSSLSELSICHCPNLQSLPESAFPSSLSKLTIEDCRNLQSLPGEYWPEIAHIPEIYISVAILRRMPVMINKKEAPTDFQCHCNSCILEVSLSKEEVFWGKYPFSVDKGLPSSLYILAIINFSISELCMDNVLCLNHELLNQFAESFGRA